MTPAEKVEENRGETMSKSDFQAILESHQLYVSQVNSDLTCWQEMCTELLSLFNLYSSLEKPTDLK